MDLFKYSNSGDVAKYLKEIGYQFNTLEPAWLIYQCQCLSMQEIHDAWLNLMKCMQDCIMPERANCRETQLFGYLHKYIEAENNMLANFYARNRNCVYFHSGNYIDETGNNIIHLSSFLFLTVAISS